MISVLRLSFMNESESKGSDRILFMNENFGEYVETRNSWAHGQIFILIKIKK